MLMQEKFDDYDETKSVRSASRSLSIQFSTARKYKKPDTNASTTSVKVNFNSDKSSKTQEQLAKLNEKVMVGLNIVDKHSKRPNLLD